ncbi:MAG: hypothetical protein WAV38_09605, partial [Xanthobacteraceae bacterium]
AHAQGWPGGENPGRAMDEAVGGHVFSDYWEQQRRGRDEQRMRAQEERLRALEERENRRNAQPEPTPRGLWDGPKLTIDPPSSDAPPAKSPFSEGGWMEHAAPYSDGGRGR